jgi:16S rRNA (guanine(966)-N(2))-methyltransferase RsmD
MRIIAGIARGRKIHCPAGLRTRPLLDRVREALFAILAPRIADAEVLDLYAGSGSLGLEALSRGARRCTFVESSRRALACLRRNLEELGFADRAAVVRGAVEAFLETLDGHCDRVDLVFLDPPYAHLRSGARRAAVLAAARRRCRRGLSARGRLVLHYPRDLLDEAELGAIGTPDLRHYGTSSLAIFPPAPSVDS